MEWWPPGRSPLRLIDYHYYLNLSVLVVNCLHLLNPPQADHHEGHEVHEEIRRRYLIIIFVFFVIFVV